MEDRDTLKPTNCVICGKVTFISLNDIGKYGRKCPNCRNKENTNSYGLLFG